MIGIMQVRCCDQPAIAYSLRLGPRLQPRSVAWLIIVLTFVLAGDSMAANSLLPDATAKSDHAAIRTLLRQLADVNAAQADGMTALHWAVYREDVETARLLIEAKADVTVTNHYGVTPLSLACQNGSAAIVELLLANGADPKTTLRGGETVLMTAARTGKPGPVAALIQRGADVNAKERRGQTALMWAAAEGNTEVVAMLIQAGADIRATLPDSGFTPMFFAARAGHLPVVQALLKAGVDVNDVTQGRRPGGKSPASGTSALILAVENGHYELALALVTAGALPNDQRCGFAPLHMMTWVRKPPRGEDRGMPPPPELQGMNSLQFVRELVKRGADVNLRLARGSGGIGKFTTKGATPFLMASATADLPYMKLLLELGADPSIANAEQTTPLIAACGIHVGSDQATELAGEEPEVLEAARLLLSLGADINAVDANGETAMHGAALKNLPKVVQFLADRGAKIEIWNRENKYGWTPLLLAEGYRPGNFKPSFETAAAIEKVMRAAGVDPDKEPRPAELNNSDWAPLSKKKQTPPAASSAKPK
jgi:ankyrin repeat protein